MARNRSRLGFLFNHDELHQIGHTAPIIVELLRSGWPGEIVVVSSSPAQTEQVRRIISVDDHRGLSFACSPPPRLATRLDRLFGKALPLERLGALVANRTLFQSLDALVVPETTSAFLKTHLGLNDLKLIYLPHGAGDRAVGFRSVTRAFDFVLLPGEKVRDRMLENGLIQSNNHAIIGYPKFDAVPTAEPQPVFDNGRPTVLYNPHFDPKLSSWYGMGKGVLDWFAGQSIFNLIVAPHVMLHRRRVHVSVEHRRIARVGDLARRYADVPHIHIDTGSQRSIDMSYTRQGDIYLGDASSQVYEFLTRPRPCLFLNSHGAEWREDPNYAHWHMGDVIDSVADLPAALQRALAFPDAYAAEQAEAMRRTFAINTRSSSGRAAEAIARFLDRI